MSAQATALSLAAPLRIAELFGPTLQGEGPSAGQRALFVRLSQCNLDCTWCDTPYTWDWRRFDRTEQSRELTVEAVRDWVLDRDAQLVVISGGEPLIQQGRLAPLAGELIRAGRRVEIETNGTITPGPAWSEQVVFNVSPKLAGSGVPAARRIRPRALRALRDCGQAVFKFVIACDADIAELAALQRDFGLAAVWVMPEGRTAQAVLDGARALVGPALAHGWHLTLRLHVQLWGDERGR
jgi:organic radical activating enzyme